MVDPYYRDERVTLYHGDCLQVLADLPADSVDAVVTDPPYGLAFMGRKWDYDVPSVEIWQQVLRVLKPGGHLLAFAGTRTQHRMAVRIEDAGFEIRDLIMWVYGSGFPKSLDVSKAIDRAAGAEREVVGQAKMGISAAGSHEGWKRPAHLSETYNITVPATDAAKQWAGYGTALKPSCEPVTMARKPLAGTVAENVLQYGTGGINVDACRVEGIKGVPASPRREAHGGDAGGVYGRYESPPTDTAGWNPNAGRWPANVIHDGSEEVVSLFPEAGGGFGKRGAARQMEGWGMGGDLQTVGFGDTGSAARFFYTAKADASERRGSKHPTVKPLDLMRYLVRLVCPVGGVVLDPFSGSGTTIEAARDEHCRSIGIEMNAEYLADTLERLKQGVLF